MAGTHTERYVTTPAERFTGLYAGYEGLLDTLDAVERKLHDHTRACTKLRRRRNTLREALADVHEKIADYDVVVWYRWGADAIVAGGLLRRDTPRETIARHRQH